MTARLDPTALSPELRILLAAAKATPAAGPIETGRCDAGELFRLAGAHRMIPRLHALTAAGNLDMPEAFRQRLADETQAIAQHNLRLTAELLDLVPGFARREIPVLVWKGPALAMAAYGNLALRGFYDLDLLVAPGAIPAAAGVLVESGYSIAHQSPDALHSIHLAGEYHFPFRKRDGGIALELHAAMVPYYFAEGPRFTGLWKRRAVCALGWGSLPVLGLEDLVLSLALHGAKHCWRQLESVAALGRLLTRSPALDWTALEDRARRLGVRRILWLALQLAETLTGIALPHPPPPCAATEALVRQVIDTFRGAGPGRPDVVSVPRFHSACCDTAARRVRYWTKAILVPNWDDFRWLPLPRGLFPLYWVLRPARLLPQHLAGFLARPRFGSGGNAI
jgi:hypothetical protein